MRFNIVIIIVNLLLLCCIYYINKGDYNATSSCKLNKQYECS